MNGWAYTLRQAAKELGVTHSTLRLWLAEIGFAIPRLPRGKSVLLSPEILERIKSFQLRKRGPVERLSLLRAKGKVA